MQINVTPHKLASQQVEVLLDGPSLSIQLGQVLRFDAPQPFYGEVVALQEERQSGLYLAKAQVVYGEPQVPFQWATVLSAEDLKAEINRLRGNVEYPFSLGNSFTGDLLSLHTLTLFTGQSLQAKQQALLEIMRGMVPYQKVLVLDPLGIFPEQPNVVRMPAGKGFGFSLQQVGMLPFLSRLEQTLPASIRQEAIHLCAQVIPQATNSLSFGYLLQRERYPEGPVTAMLLHSLAEVGRLRLFAESDAEAFSFSKVLKAPINVLDLSTAPAPWRSVLYETLCQEILKYPETDAAFVLVYPERYLSDLLPWITQAEALGLTLLVLTAPEETLDLRAGASNILQVERGHHRLQGTLTLGLPLNLSEAKAPVMAATPPVPARQNPFAEIEIQPLRQDPIPLETEFLMETPFHSPSVPEAFLQDEEASVEPLPETVTGEMFSFEELSAMAPLSLEPLDHVDHVQRSPEPDAEEEGEELHFELLEVSPTSPSVESHREVDISCAHTLFPEEASVGGESFEAPSQNGHDTSEPALELPVFETYETPISEVLEPMEQDVTPVYRTHELEQQALSQQVGHHSGERIRHEKYGVGVITKVIPMDGSVVLNVTFDSVGKRLLDPALTQLEKV